MPSDPAAIRPATLLDSRVLLDVITGDEQWADWSAEQIAAALDAGRVVINPLVYAEVSVGYETVEELDELLPASGYEREPLPYLAGFAAGKAFVRYRRGGGDKRSPMPDFYIGAHAAVAGYRLLTRDVRHYRTYFPTIEIIAPALAEDETAGQIPAAQLALLRECESDELEPGQDAHSVRAVITSADSCAIPATSRQATSSADMRWLAPTWTALPSGSSPPPSLQPGKGPAA